MQSTKGHVDSFVKENKGLKTKVKSLEEQLLESKKEVGELDERHNHIEATIEVKSVGTFPVILLKLATPPLPPQTKLNLDQNG